MQNKLRLFLPLKKHNLQNHQNDNDTAPSKAYRTIKRGLQRYLK